MVITSLYEKSYDLNVPDHILLDGEWVHFIKCPDEIRYEFTDHSMMIMVMNHRVIATHNHEEVFNVAADIFAPTDKLIDFATYTLEHIINEQKKKE